MLDDHFSAAKFYCQGLADWFPLYSGFNYCLMNLPRSGNQDISGGKSFPNIKG